MTAKTVLLLGATGTIGRATFAELKAAGHKVIAPVRAGSRVEGIDADALRSAAAVDVLAQEPVDAVISCLASRTGLDAWEVDHAMNSRALKAAMAANVRQFVLLSAICVQKPRLSFQQAKLAFEAELRRSEITWSIVRTTAYFKSLSGQLTRVTQGKPFLLFGDGALTRCKPISDRDTARYLVRCLTDDTLENRILPIGGPGPAITPREQGEMLFKALGQTPRFKHVPVALMKTIIATVSPLGLFSTTLREKAELARIGHYYATESMLVWDDVQGRYDADKTPEFGQDRLADHYAALAAGKIAVDRGQHAVF